MFENAAEKDLKARLTDAGANYFGGSFLSLLDGAGIKAVEELEGGRFRVSTPLGFHETPGSYAGIRESLEGAAASCGFDIESSATFGGFVRYVLAPRI